MGEYTATFGDEDFERWWLAGMDRDDILTDRNQQELFDNCVYLAQAERRTLTQSHEELQAAIADWAQRWNADATNWGRDEHGRVVRIGG